MKIIVCIKQVPDIRVVKEVKIDPDAGTMVREGIPSTVNPGDECAVEEAVKIRDRCGGQVTVITMGPPQAKDALIKCLAMGADNAIHLCSKAFAGADTLATSYAISSAIKKIGSFDIVICGQYSLDGETAQVGPSIAEYLQIPQITRANRVEIKNGKVLAWQEMETECWVVESGFPILLTVTGGINEPRIPAFSSIADAFEKDLLTWTHQDIGVDVKRIGIEGSPTEVIQVSSVERGHRGQILDGEPVEVASRLINRLKQEKVL